MKEILRGFKKRLLKIKARYGRKVYDENNEFTGKFKVGHHGDCRIYKAELPHCSCGLIHDLMIMPSFADVIYPKYDDDWATSDRCSRDWTPPTDEEMKELDRIMEEAGFKTVEPTEEQVALYNAQMDVINKIFLVDSVSPEK